MPIKTTRLWHQRLMCEKFHNPTSNDAVLTVPYTAGTAGVKSRSSRGCCAGPLGILKERVKDKRTQKCLALALTKKIIITRFCQWPKFCHVITKVTHLLLHKTGKQLFHISSCNQSLQVIPMINIPWQLKTNKPPHVRSMMRIYHLSFLGKKTKEVCMSKRSRKIHGNYWKGHSLFS